MAARGVSGQTLTPRDTMRQDGSMKTPPVIKLPKQFTEYCERFAADPVELAYRVLRRFAAKERTHLTIKAGRRYRP